MLLRKFYVQENDRGKLLHCPWSEKLINVDTILV